MKQSSNTAVKLRAVPREESLPAAALILAPDASAETFSRTRSISLFWLFLFLLVNFAYFHHTGGHNENARFDQIRAFVETGRWDLGNYRFNTADVIEVNGKFFPNKPPGTTLLGIIPWWISGKLLSLFALPGSSSIALQCYFTTVLCLGVASSLLGVLLYLTLLRFGRSPGEALTLTLFSSLGTIAFPFSTVFFSHQITACVLFLAFYLLWTASLSPVRSRLRIFLGGALLGFSLHLDYPAAIGCLLIGIYGLSVLSSWKDRSALIAGGSLLLLALLAYNYAAFQRYFFITYSAYADIPTPAFPAHTQGIAGVGMPQLSTLLAITFERERGLFYVNPWLVLFFPSLFLIVRRRPFRKELVLSAAMVLSFFLFNAGYGDSIVYWGGACSVGPRHIIPMLPFMALAISILWEKRPFRFLLCSLGALSIFIMLIAAAVEPRVPYEAHEPVISFFLRNYLLGQLTLGHAAVFGPDPVFGDHASFTLGRLLGFDSRSELIGLAILWAVILPQLLRHREIRSASGEAGILTPSAVLSLTILAVAFMPKFVHAYAAPRPGNVPGLLGTYVKGTPWSKMDREPDLSAIRPEQVLFTRRDRRIDFDWSSQPEKLTPPFSIFWTGEVFAPSDGWYQFTTRSDDGSAVYIDGQLLVDNWGVHAAVEKTAAIQLSKGYHAIRVYYDNREFSGVMRLSWGAPGLPPELPPVEVLSSPP